MSTCISRHGEFGSHEYGEGSERFVCQLCGVLDEDAMLAALAEVEAERDRLQAERDLQLSLSGDDWLRDQHARYHDEPGNMFGPGECGWDHCWFIEVAEWVLNAPRADRDPVHSEAVRRKVEDLCRLWQAVNAANETAKDYADEVAAAHAERDELRAELERWRAGFQCHTGCTCSAHTPPHDGQVECDPPCCAHAEVKRLREAVERVRALVNDSQSRCAVRGCREHLHPLPTAAVLRALDGAE